MKRFLGYFGTSYLIYNKFIQNKKNECCGIIGYIGKAPNAQ